MGKNDESFSAKNVHDQVEVCNQETHAQVKNPDWGFG